MRQIGGNNLAEIKVVATDIDGTLFDDDKNYDVKRLNDYIDKLHQKDILFTVASGNNYDHLRRIFEKTPDIDLFIAENGAQIVEAGKTIFEHPMPKTLVHDMIKALTSELDLKSLSISGKKATYAESKKDLPLYHMKNLKIVPDLFQVDDTFFKFNIQLQHDDLTQAIEFLNKHYGNDVYAAVSGFGSIDIMRSNIDKGIALNRLSRLKGIPLTEIMAFGDNLNDLEMIQEVGLGVAMKNAKLEVLQASDLVTETDNNHDGVLNTLQTYFKL